MSILTASNNFPLLIDNGSIVISKNNQLIYTNLIDDTFIWYDDTEQILMNTEINAYPPPQETDVDLSGFTGFVCLSYYAEDGSDIFPPRVYTINVADNQNTDLAGLYESGFQSLHTTNALSYDTSLARATNHDIYDVTNTGRVFPQSIMLDFSTQSGIIEENQAYLLNISLYGIEAYDVNVDMYPAHIAPLVHMTLNDVIDYATIPDFYLFRSLSSLNFQTIFIARANTFPTLTLELYFTENENNEVSSKNGISIASNICSITAYKYPIIHTD